MLLKDIATIKSGLVLARKKAETKHEIEKEYRLLTAKKLSEDGAFNNEPLEKFHSSDKLDRQYFTKAGDIAMRLGSPYTAVCINDEHEDLLVPSYFAIIRLRDNSFLPEYVALYLNSDEVKKELLKSQSGTVIPTTNRKVLGELNIPKLPIGKQWRLIDLHRLHVRDKQLLSELIEEKEKLYKAVINKVVRIQD